MPSVSDVIDLSADPTVAPAGQRLRRIATGLLVVMVGLYALARTQEAVHPAWGFVRAFAEAAMIGGLADWFAVTAIFRRPLGLPIPHTAVIPNNQERIADSIGAFIAGNFLSPELVAQRLGRVDATRALALRLADPKQADAFAGGIVRAFPALIDTFDETAVAEFFARQARTHNPGGALAMAGGLALDGFIAQGRHQALIDAGLSEAWRLLEAHEPALRERVRANTGWFWRVIHLDARAADAMVRSLEDTLADAVRDPNHPLRVRIATAARAFAEDLRTSPELQSRVQAFLVDFLDQPAAAAAIGDFWRALREGVAEDCARPDSRLRQEVANLLRNLGAGLLEDDAARAALNERLVTVSVGLARAHGGDVAAIVAETIKSWDAETVTAKLEQGLGRDLQFIRLNGTLIGGLIGLSLHGIVLLVEQIAGTSAH